MRHTCRGTINLATANITVEDSCNFIISNGGAQTYHLKASSEVERQRWVTALELAKAKAVKMLEESGMAQGSPIKLLRAPVLQPRGPSAHPQGTIPRLFPIPKLPLLTAACKANLCFPALICVLCRVPASLVPSVGWGWGSCVHPHGSWQPCPGFLLPALA